LGVRQETLSLWQRRKQLPRLPLPGALAALFLYGLLCALSAQCGPFAVLGAAVSGSVPAALFLLHRTPFAAVVPLGAIGTVVLFARDGLSAVLTLLSVVLGISAAGAVYGGKSRLFTSVLGGICCGVTGAAAGGILLLQRNIPLTEVLPLLRNSLLEALLALTLHFPDGHTLPVFSPEAAQVLLDTLTPLMPAILGTVLFLMGYISTGCLRMILTVLGAREDFLGDPWHLRSGRECALLYCGAQLFLLLAILTPRAQALYYVCCNVSALFMLPLALTGFGELFRLSRTYPSMGATARAAVICLGIMLLAAGIHWLFTAAAFYGVYLAFRRERKE